MSGYPGLIFGRRCVGFGAEGLVGFFLGGGVRVGSMYLDMVGSLGSVGYRSWEIREFSWCSRWPLVIVVGSRLQLRCPRFVLGLVWL